MAGQFPVEILEPVSINNNTPVLNIMGPNGSASYVLRNSSDQNCYFVIGTPVLRANPMAVQNWDLAYVLSNNTEVFLMSFVLAPGDNVRLYLRGQNLVPGEYDLNIGAGLLARQLGCNNSGTT
ncbi:unnamed protein product, partial [Mesorhabditis belari]|uniref:Uncharacterized protein n=1 Tax=Mesorhabditis belari TaxID=2138241 RepID=A0AAF3F5E3_9BILA